MFRCEFKAYIIFALLYLLFTMLCHIFYNRLFFNHWFNKRFNEEPSPLEVEIFKYQQDLDNYLNYKENEYNARDVPK